MSRQNYWVRLIALFSLCTAVRAEIEKDEFSHVNHLIMALHAPIIKNHLHSKLELVEIFDDFGGAFKVDFAFKPLNEHRYVVTLTGKVPQTLSMSMDGYAIVACHELGHILGDGSKQSSILSRWSATEGEADYYATNECLWKYIQSEQSRDVIHSFERAVVMRCEKKFSQSLKEMLGCIRIMSGILAMADYFNMKKAESGKVSIHRHDATVVLKTLQKYPSPQCRVDTWIAGLFNEPRPRCWFNG